MAQQFNAKKALQARDRELWTIAKLLGLVKYDSVRPCIRCNGKERYVINQGCVACATDKTARLNQKRRRVGHATTRQAAIELREPYFYPAHRCKHGHLSRWSVRLNECMMCVRGRRSRRLHENLAAAEKVAADLQKLESFTDEQIQRMAEE